MGFVEAVAERLTVKAGALVLVSIWVLYLVVGRIDEIRRIRRLGAPEAAKIKTYLPFSENPAKPPLSYNPNHPIDKKLQMG